MIIIYLTINYCFLGRHLRPICAEMHRPPHPSIGAELPLDRHPQTDASRGASLKIPGVQGLPEENPRRHRSLRQRNGH